MLDYSYLVSRINSLFFGHSKFTYIRRSKSAVHPCQQILLKGRKPTRNRKVEHACSFGCCSMWADPCVFTARSLLADRWAACKTDLCCQVLRPTQVCSSFSLVMTFPIPMFPCWLVFEHRTELQGPMLISKALDQFLLGLLHATQFLGAMMLLPPSRKC